MTKCMNYKCCLKSTCLRFNISEVDGQAWKMYSYKDGKCDDYINRIEVKEL